MQDTLHDDPVDFDELSSGAGALRGSGLTGQRQAWRFHDTCISRETSADSHGAVTNEGPVGKAAEEEASRRVPDLPTPLDKPSSLWQRRKMSCSSLSLQPRWPKSDATDNRAQVRQDFLRRTYDISEKLGAGAIGNVYRATRVADGQLVALKVLRSSDTEKLQVARKEFDLLRTLHHKHIIRAWDFHAFGLHDVMSLEFFPGETLQAAVEAHGGGACGVPKIAASGLGAALFGAVAYLHGRNLIHRDVTPSNVLVSNDLADLRLVDFHCACAHEGSCCEFEPLTPTGAMLYASPEVIAGEPSSMPSDVWSAGLCLYLMFTGQLPQRRGQVGSDFSHAALARAASRRVEVSGVPEGYKEVTSACLALDPVERPTAEEAASSVLAPQVA